MSKITSDGITAADILKAGLGHMQDRAVTYDNPQGERSMGMTVAMANVLLAKKLREPLSEEDGWNFMELLKLVRSKQGEFKADNYEDRSAYAGLAGESAARDRRRPIIRELYTAHQATPNVWEDGEQRMEQIGLNGNDGEHYIGGKPLEV